MRVETGLFVNWEKSDLLISIVEDILSKRFKTEVVRGPMLPNNSCELVLRALQPKGANFTGSKELLENYLRMIKESKSNVFLGKLPEVIDLDTDNDEISCIVLDDADESVTVIDQDNSIENSKSSNNSNQSNLTEFVVIDPLEQTKCLSKAKKRKRDFEVEEENRIEVIEILDDDVITVEDSFSVQNSNTLSPSQKCESADFKISLISDSKPVNQKYKCEEKELRTQKAVIEIHPDNRSNVVSEPGTSLSSDLKTIARISDNSTSIVENSVKTPAESVNDNISTNHNNSSLPVPASHPKKKSKLSYKRPAHLIQPLTQSNQNQQTKTDSSSNIFNPNAGIVEKRSGLRPIVIDGSNVAISHGMGNFSLKGIKICINFFEKRGHRQIKAFIPHYRKNRDNFDDLHKMERLGTVVLTPSRKVDGKIVASYDDRYIVQYAAEFGGVIVSTDNFRDLLQENPVWKETIEKRLLMFTWVEDLLMFPQDPLGKNGPSLDEFLKFDD